MTTRIVARRMSIAAGLITFLLVFAGFVSHPVFPIVAVLLMVSGGTDFGRQCPLIFSARHLYLRLKNGTKFKPPKL